MTSKTRGGLGWILCAVLTLVVSSTALGAVPFQTGDVFAGIGNGRINHFRPDGTLVQTLITGAGNTVTEDTGMGLDAAGNLYATTFQANNVYKFDNSGNLLGSFGSGYNLDPESIIFDKDGNAYVGHADGTKQVRKFNAAGALVDTFSPQTTDRGTDWIDLAVDQCTLFYTSEGSTIKRYNVCTKTQLADFATGLTRPCFALRIRPNSEVLVACASRVYRLSPTGATIQTYPFAGTSLLFALNLDPDNKTFWTGDLRNGSVFRVDIATGNIVTQFSAGILRSLGGLTVYGEITAATTAPPSTTSYYVQTRRSETLSSMGAAVAQSQIAAGTAQDSVAVLHFGGPTKTIGTNNTPLYGATGFSRTAPLLLADIANLAEAFAIGYYNALGTNQTHRVRLVIATSNSQTRAIFGGNQVTFEHGQAWAQTVQDIAARIIARRYSAQVDVAGGIDVEMDFNTPAVSRAWVDGYASVPLRRYLYNIGDAGGCPRVGTTATPANCNNSWKQEDVWYVSWGADPAVPLPEIYQTSNPAQWAQLSLYGSLNPSRRNGGSMIIAGALTEFQACFPDPNNLTSSDPTCNSLFVPSHGWQQLFNSLNARSATAQSLSWTTDIKWSTRQ